MATTEKTVAARTGEQFLDGLRGDAREIWLNGEKITHPLEHPALEAAARTMARVYDLQHEHADEMLAPAPDTGALVNVTHLIPRSKEDLERRRRAVELTAALTAGMMGRTPDYLNVTFACFAGRSDVWARRGNDAGRRQHRRLPARDARPRPLDDALDHEPPGRPHEARGRPGCRRGGAAQDRRDRDPHHGARRADAGDAGAVRRRAHDLSGLGHPPAGRALRALVRDPDGHARAEVHLPRLVLEAARPVRLPALVALRRDGRGGDLRRRRGAEEPRVPRRRHGRLLRGHLRHRVARPHHAPGVHARPREAVVRVRARPPASPTRPVWGGSTTSRRSSGRCGTWSS